MSDRFYCGPITAEPGGVIVLSGPEAHHLLRVMRAKPGRRVILFDGQGTEFYAELLQGKKGQAELRILSLARPQHQLLGELWVACALPKGDRQRWLVEKLVELGVARLVPVMTDRSVARPTAEARERLQRAVIEACKQCGRSRLMEIAPPERWSAFCQRQELPQTRLLAHPLREDEPLSSPVQPQPKTSPLSPLQRGQAVVIAIGPEGGFSPAEVALACARGWQPVDLGPLILRTETAAVMLASAILARLIGLL